MPVKGVLEKQEDGTVAMELHEDTEAYTKYRKDYTHKVYSDGRGGIYQLEFDFEDPVAPI